jgi:phage shock protein PspC (stress-responsive transcriptional regulator)
MNKTIIININGTVFHIEEDAYEVLKNYMTDVKRHFLNSADSLEITTDIENRIAEMFSELLARDNKQVIVEQDVKLVIEQMGTVEDFEHADEDNHTAANDHYAYNNGSRSLFRDPDDHLIGGVCAGLANYFNINAVWVRLIFALSTAFAGTGLVLYIILWMVIPKAITRGDRMAMKGQKLDLQGFKANFEEELNNIKGNLSDLHNEARPLVYKFRDFSGEVFHHTGKFLSGAGNLFVKLLGITVLLACFAGVIALVVSLALAEVWGQAPIHLFPFNVVANEYANKIYFSAFFVAFIPLLAIILTVIKALFKTRSMDVNIGILILVIWLFSVGTLVFYGSKVSAGFRSSASFNQTVSIQPTKNNIYYLKLNDVKYFTHEDSLRLDIKSHFKNMIVTDDDDNINDFEPKSVYIHIEKSDVSQPMLVESFRSQGSQYEDALFNARNTSYLFTQQDTVLKFDRALQRAAGTSWHGQQVELTLRIPLNATVVIDERLDRYLDGIDIRQCKENNKQPDATTASFTMTANGLECKIDTLVTAAVKADSARMINK